jgi:hypothetical protein
MTDGLRAQTPDMADLLRTVREFVVASTGKLPAEDRYQAQVAAYLLSICERELASSGKRIEGTDALCRAIRSGQQDGTWESLIAALLDETAAAVSVTRPDHLAPMHKGN